MATTPQAPELPPPGWYDDPYGAPQLRYWNGFAWTDQVTADGTSMRPFGEWITRAFELISAQAGPLFTLVALSIPLTVAASIALWQGIGNVEIDFRGLESIDNNADLTLGEVLNELLDAIVVSGVDYRGLGAAGVLYLLGMLFNLVLSVAFTRQLHTADLGANEGWAASLRVGFGRLPRMIGVQLAYYLIVFGLIPIGLVMMILGATQSGPVAAVGALVFLVGVAVALFFGVRLWICRIPASVAPKGVRSIQTAWGLSRQRYFAFVARGAIIVAGWMMVSSLASSISSVGAPGAPVSESPDVLAASDLFGGLAFIMLSSLINSLMNQFGRVVQLAGGVVVYDDLGGPSEIEPSDTEAATNSDVEGFSGYQL